MCFGDFRLRVGRLGGRYFSSFRRAGSSYQPRLDVHSGGAGARGRGRGSGRRGYGEISTPSCVDIGYLVCYDPIFFLPKLNKTFAQLSDDQKDQISHRGNASRSLIQLVDQ